MHHLCSNALFDGGELSQRYCSTECACIHCMSTRGQVEPRPYGRAHHATKPNEVLHFDFLELPEDLVTKDKYLLVMKDDYSGFADFVGTASNKALDAYEGLMSWFSRYGVVPTWVE